MTGKKFFIVFILLALIDFIVPFYLLGGTARWTGSYLYWCGLTLTVIVAGSFYIKRTWGGR